MDSLPDWLEPLVCLEDFGGDTETYIDHLFTIFTRDFVTTKPQYNGNPVFHDRGIEDDKPRSFTHITTEEDRGTKQRVISLRRCERIPWIKAIIEHADDPAILVWEKEQATSRRWATRTYFFLEKGDFLVILEQLRNGHSIITAIYVDNPNQKRRHLEEYEELKKLRN